MLFQTQFAWLPDQLGANIIDFFQWIYIEQFNHQNSKVKVR